MTSKKARAKKYYKKNRVKLLEWTNAYRHKLRAEVLKAYGNRCTCCGESQEKFLTIDHIFNDGAKEREDSKGGVYLKLRKKGFPKSRHQILCMNCNWAKRLGTCPHKLQEK